MLYKEYKPALQLQNWVECYWKFVMPANAAAPVQPVTHVFPPEGSCSLLFIKVPLMQFEAVMFAGASTVVHEVNVFPQSINFGIRLNPGYSACLHPANPSAILNTSAQVNAPTAWQLSLLNKIDVDFDEPELVDELLLKNCIPLINKPDERVDKAVNLILQHSGSINLKKLSEQCYLSERQLQRLFTRYTGITIKQFCQIRRLRQALINFYVQHKSSAQMVHDRGFADQAHFYKSFRNVAAYKLEKFLNHIHLIDHQLIS